MTTTLYKKVYNELKYRIQSGIYPSKTALPSEPKLKEMFSVSMITIRRAIYELVLDGLVESRQGLGSFVRDPAENSIAVGMSSFTSDIASGRLRIIRTLMSDSLIEAPLNISDKFGIQQGSMLRCFVRLDNESGVPMSIDNAYISPVSASTITPEMAASPLFMHLWQQASEITLVKTIYDISVEKSI